MSKWQYTLNIAEEFKKANYSNTKEDNLVLLDKLISELAVIKETKIDDEILDENISNFENLRADLWDNVFDEIHDFQTDFNYYFELLYDWADMIFEDGCRGVMPTKNCWIKTII